MNDPFELSGKSRRPLDFSGMVFAVTLGVLSADLIKFLVGFFIGMSGIFR